MSKFQHFLKHFFHDAQGNLTIIQFPNLSAILTVIFVLLSWVTSSWPHTIFRLTAIATGLWWGYLELRYGANYFRRILGFIVAIILLKSIIKA